MRHPKYGTTDEWKTPEYRTWIGIKARCTNSKNVNWPRYGAKGIHVCERWEYSYTNFLEDMGRRPTPKHSIDRLDCRGHYAPDNCRWATRIEQQNNRPDNRRLSFQGQSKTIAEWSRVLNISYVRFKNHLVWHHYDVDAAVKGILNLDNKATKSLR